MKRTQVQLLVFLVFAFAALTFAGTAAAGWTWDENTTGWTWDGVNDGGDTVAPASDAG
jgi:hypothetical protein